MASRSQVRSVSLIVSSACNMACSYCYQNDKKRGRMRWSVAVAALDLLLASDHAELALNFVGGEALLERDLLVRAVEYFEQRRAPTQRVRYSVGTNGLLLDEETARFLAAHRFHTYLSFDGVAAAQDLRGVGTFGRLDALLDRLRRDHPAFFRERLHVTMTVQPSTVMLVPESIRYLLAKGVRQIELSPLMTDSSGWDPRRRTELEASFDEVAREVRRHFEQTGDIPLQTLRGGGSECRPEPGERSMCGVGGGENLAVDVDGQTTGCVTFVGSYQRFPPFLAQRLAPMALGGIDAPQLDARLESYPGRVEEAEIFDHKERKHSSYGRCADCRYLASCDICPMSIGHQRGNVDPHRVPDFLCAWNLVWGRLREEMPRQRLRALGRPPALLDRIHAAATGVRA